MITEKDLNQAIAECQGQRNPNASTCIKLAAYLTIKESLYGRKEESYSYANVPGDVVVYSGESEFAKAIEGRRQDDIMPILDELMGVLQATNPRLYAGVMRKIDN